MAFYVTLRDIVTLPILILIDIMKLAILTLIPTILQPKKNIKNEIVLITGGGSGFGQTLAVKLAEMGCRIVIWDVDEAGSAETERLVKRVNGTLRKYILDVSIKEDVYRVAKRVEREVGPVTILVNNAGIAYKAPFLDTPDAAFEKLMAVNALAHVWTLKAFLPSMVANNRGHIVCVASIAGLGVSEQASAYCSSKHAVNGLMNAVTMDLIAAKATGVKTTIVHPAISATPMFQSSYDGYLPFLSQERVADEIIRGILTNKEVVYIPKMVSIIEVGNVIISKNVFFRAYRFLGGRAIINTLKFKKIFKEQME